MSRPWHTNRLSNKHKQILIQASSGNDKPVKRKTGLCGVLVVLGACCLSGCNGDTPGSMPGRDDRPVTDTHTTGITINSEGEKLFSLRCGACHAVNPDQPSVVGPSLAGVFGRAAGSVEGFPFSRAMQAYGKKWTPENMNEFLEKPYELVPGNRMAFAGLSDAEQRKLIIEYLEIAR